MFRPIQAIKIINDEIMATLTKRFQDGLSENSKRNFNEILEKLFPIIKTYSNLTELTIDLFPFFEDANTISDFMSLASPENALKLLTYLVAKNRDIILEENPETGRALLHHLLQCLSDFRAHDLKLIHIMHTLNLEKFIQLFLKTNPSVFSLNDTDRINPIHLLCDVFSKMVATTLSFAADKHTLRENFTSHLQSHEALLSQLIAVIQECVTKCPQGFNTLGYFNQEESMTPLHIMMPALRDLLFFYQNTSIFPSVVTLILSLMEFDAHKTMNKKGELPLDLFLNLDLLTTEPRFNFKPPYTQVKEYYALHDESTMQADLAIKALPVVLEAAKSIARFHPSKIFTQQRLAQIEKMYGEPVA